MLGLWSSGGRSISARYFRGKLFGRGRRSKQNSQITESLPSGTTAGSRP